MMDERWEARVIFNPGRITNSVYISRRRAGTGGVREFLRPDDMVVTVIPGKPLKDEEIIFASLDDDQLQALQTAITDHGIKRPDAGFVEGKLVATERHLEDMRQIVGHIKKLPLGGDKIEYRSHV